MPARSSIRTAGIAVALIAAVGLVLTPIPAGAEDGAPGSARWAVAPAATEADAARTILLVEAEPGARVDDAVDVANLGTDPLELDVYAHDAVNTAAGEFTLLPASEPTADAGGWIALAAPTVAVEPGAAVRVPLSIEIPADATPGDHAAGIVAARLIGAGDAGGAELAVDQRVGTRVIVRVAGELAPSLRVHVERIDADPLWFPFGDLGADVHYRLTNTGNVAVGGSVRLTTTGPFGLELGEPVGVEVPLVLPGNTVSGTLRTANALPLGVIQAELLATSETETGFGPVDAVVARGTGSALAIPVGLLAAVLLAIAAGVLVNRRRPPKRQK